jgi:Tetratricopeptide repeat
MVFQAEDRARTKRQQAEVAIQMALQGQWDDAVQLNQQIIGAFPTDVDAYNRLGKALTELGRYGDAREAYEQALNIDAMNSIARKNLTRLASLGEAAPPRPAAQKLSPQMFIEETGKTGITTLAKADMDVALRMTAGDQVQLARQDGTLVVQALDGEYVGEIEPRLGQRLVKLMDGGNKYVAAISALDDGSVKLFIRETFQHASQTGKLSFPPTVTETFRPYVKERLLRNDGDDDGLFDEGDEAEDWTGPVDDSDDETVDSPGFELGGRGSVPNIDLDDEIEE